VGVNDGRATWLASKWFHEGVKEGRVGPVLRLVVPIGEKKQNVFINKISNFESMG